MKTRWLVEITVTSFGLFAVAACAHEKTPFGSGNGGDGGDTGWTGPSSSSSSSSSGKGGAGGAGGGSSSNGMGGASSSSASSASSASSSGPCMETPCKLVPPQCGCAGGEMCTIDGTPAGTRLCVAAGAVAIGGACTGSDCSAGSLCVTTAGMKSTCRSFCSTDANCTGPGGLCVTKLNDGSSGQIPGVTLCSDNCDPTTNVGCSVPGMSCQVAKESAGQMRLFTQCAGSGTGTQGTPCTNSANCAPMYGCYNAGTTQCLRYCKIGGAACPAGTCNKLMGMIGATEYGVCL